MIDRSKLKNAACAAMALILLFSLCACWKIDHGEPAVTSDPEALASDTAVPTVSPVPTEAPKPTIFHYDLDIPVFSEDKLFGHLYSNYDWCICDDSGLRPHVMQFLMNEADMHTDAIRVMNNGDKYAIFGSDTGYRLYVIFGSLGNDECAKGFPIIIGRLRSYEEFASLKVGDPIELVARIDPIAERLMRSFATNDHFPYYIHSDALSGWALTTFHYLSDGVLKIEYDMTKDRQLFIYSIEYAEDYKLVSNNGKSINYKLFDVDLPPQSEFANEAPIGPAPETEVYASVPAAEPLDRDEELCVPVYTEEEVFGLIDPATCYSDRRSLKFYINEMDYYAYELEGSAVRRQTDNDAYMVCDTDTGYRVYLFFTRPWYDMKMKLLANGYPVILGAGGLLSHDDFANLREGDSIDRVVMIDPTTAVLRDSLGSGYSAVTFHDRLESGFPIASLHYLSDGILKIAYDCADDGSIVIANMEYSADYRLKDNVGGLNGRGEVDYRILNKDLPNN